MLGSSPRVVKLLLQRNKIVQHLLATNYSQLWVLGYFSIERFK